MARKLNKKTIARPEEGRDDLAVLHPELEITVAGRDLVVREYGLVDGLRLRAQLRPFTAALQAQFERGGALVEDVMDLIAEHWDSLRGAVAQSAGVEAEWIDGLGDADGDLLLNAWWGVCGPFFVRQILRRAAEQARRQALAGPTSTSSSSMPDTAPLANSAATPSGSSDSSTNA